MYALSTLLLFFSFSAFTVSISWRPQKPLCIQGCCNAVHPINSGNLVIISTKVANSSTSIKLKNNYIPCCACNPSPRPPNVMCPEGCPPEFCDCNRPFEYIPPRPGASTSLVDDDDDDNTPEAKLSKMQNDGFGHGQCSDGCMQEGTVCRCPDGPDDNGPSPVAEGLRAKAQIPLGEGKTLRGADIPQRPGANGKHEISEEQGSGTSSPAGTQHIFCPEGCQQDGVECECPEMFRFRLERTPLWKAITATIAEHLNGEPNEHADGRLTHETESATQSSSAQQWRVCPESCEQDGLSCVCPNGLRFKPNDPSQENLRTITEDKPSNPDATTNPHLASPIPNTRPSPIIKLPKLPDIHIAWSIMCRDECIVSQDNSWCDCSPIGEPGYFTGVAYRLPGRGKHAAPPRKGDGRARNNAIHQEANTPAGASEKSTPRAGSLASRIASLFKNATGLFRGQNPAGKHPPLWRHCPENCEDCDCNAPDKWTPPHREQLAGKKDEL